MLSERRYYFRTAVLLPMLIGLTSFLCGQEVGNFRGTKDTIKAFVKAAALQRIDTLKKFPERFSTNLRIKKNNIAKSVTSIFDQTANPDTSEIFQTVRKPITFTGGFFIYNTDFRSLIDTPFAEKGIVQHSVSSSLRFNVLNRVPFQVNIYLRETNSRFFKDIYDAQVVFDPVAFRTLFCNTMNSFVSKESDKWKDKSLEKLYTNNFNEGNRLNNFLKDPVAVQKLIEYNELIRVPKVIYDFNLSDSINFRRTDSLMKVASLFVQRYATTKQKYDSLRLQTDSLELAVYKWTSRIQQFRTALQNRQVDATFYKEFAESAKEREIEVNYPKYLEWLLGVRNLAIGRTPLNYCKPPVNPLFEYFSGPRIFVKRIQVCV